MTVPGPNGLENRFLRTPPYPDIPVEELTSDSGEESGEESDHEWEVITIDDDDDVKPRKAPKEMVCYRCPNKRDGTFRDERKYWTHIARHVLPDIFSCVTCQRSFHKLTHCLSHELRVHGTPLSYDAKDKVISTAKAYLKGRKEMTNNNKSETNTQNFKDDDEIDSEDVMFYGDHFVCSSSLYPYRGPKVETMLEAYEIQYSYASRRKTPRLNSIAKLAIDIHEQNVKKDQDRFKLGRFCNRKNRFKKAPVAVKKASKRTPKTAISAIPAPVQLKRPRDVLSESESTNEKPKKKRVITKWFSSSESENSADDLDYLPSEEKKSNNIRKGSDHAVAGPSGTQQNKTSRKRQNEDPVVEPSKKRMCFSALLKRDCQLCSYVWETENELRMPRDQFHANVRLLDLMAVPAPVKKQKSTKKLKATKPEVNKKETKQTKKSATRKRNRKQSNNTTDPARKRAVRQGRSQNPKRRPPVVPEPDESFSSKEVFLHNFGLINCVRLHLHQKKAIADLKLPQFNVVLTRLTDWEIAACKNGGASRLQDYLPPHFLLG